MRWQKGELIGVGAFGRVYVGLDEDTNELLAVKEVRVLYAWGVERAAGFSIMSLSAGPGAHAHSPLAPGALEREHNRESARAPQRPRVRGRAPEAAVASQHRAVSGHRADRHGARIVEKVIVATLWHLKHWH